MSLICTSFCQRLSNDSTNKKRLKFGSRICDLIRLLSVILGWTMYQKTNRLSVSGKHLMDTPWQFTQETLMAYRSLYAYNYFQGEWIYVGLHSTQGCKNFFLKTKVNKSKWTDKSQETYVCEKKDNTILNAHWTCRAVFFTVNILN